MEFPKDAKTVSFIECLLTRLEFYDKEAGFNVSISHMRLRCSTILIVS